MIRPENIGSEHFECMSFAPRNSSLTNIRYHFLFPGEFMATLTQAATRTEKDSLGTKEIPANVYYGIQTTRAVENYPISGMRAHPTLITVFGMVKEAAAEANRDLGLVDPKIANAIIQ